MHKHTHTCTYIHKYIHTHKNDKTYLMVIMTID
uniref:Uncharacterized protein n=1 Tax=Schistosoma curassoni TaxID=6186 RepID=A0A183KW74_9TREM